MSTSCRSVDDNKGKECFVSSSSHLKSYFVGMGFEPTLVEKVLEENGEDDANLVLETLFTYSALHNSSAGPPDLPDGKGSSSKNEATSCVFSPDSGPNGKGTCSNNEAASPAFSTDDSLDLEEFDETGEVVKSTRDSLLTMNFSEVEVDFAIKQLGHDAPITQLVDFILVTQRGGRSGDNETDESVDVKEVKVITTETLFGTMDKTLRLLQMGFTADEISSAIDRFGAEAPVLELADSIFAYQIAKTCVEDEKDLSQHQTQKRLWNEKRSRCRGSSTAQRMKRGFTVIKREVDEASSSYQCPGVDDSDFGGLGGAKKAKYMQSNDKFPSMLIPKVEPGAVKLEDENNPTPNSNRGVYQSAGTGQVKSEIPDQSMPQPCRNLHQLVAEPPYFFYGSVANMSRASWDKVSQFLYAIEPEFVNTQYFSALIRREGYVHNLPTDNRFHILPLPPMTIEEALPHTKKWWPSWDTRKQLSCIRFETAGVTEICQRLGGILIGSHGLPSKEQQTRILHQCKTWNLVWVGQYKLNPIEPHQVESILGYPLRHTETCNLSLMERLKLLKFSFQIDTLGYHLSSLKSIFPDGLTVLSLFSGTGGAEIALHKLGIRLKCVVVVESSKVNREIIKKWWHESKQTGELKIFDDIQKLTGGKLESLVGECGAFDVVIGGNPGSHLSQSPKIYTDLDGPVEVDYPLFYEFVRVLQRVRSIMGRNR